MLDFIEHIGYYITAVILVLFAVLCIFYRKADRIVIEDLLRHILWECHDKTYRSVQEAEEAVRGVVNERSLGRWFWVKVDRIPGGINVRVRSLLYWGKTYYGAYINQ